MDSNKDLGEQPTEMKSDTTEQIQDIAQDVKQTDDDWNGVDEMESLCMSCGASGITRMKMHKIPNFRELLIASFTCDECGEFNNEVTFGGEIQAQGCRCELLVTQPDDLDRQMVKSDSCSIILPDIEFEIPPMTQKGEINTMEGFLSTAAKNLSLYQADRLRENPDIGLKVAEIISTLTNYSERLLFPFKIIMDDPAGNSFIENPYLPNRDPHMTICYYYRSPEQDVMLGLQPDSYQIKLNQDSNFEALKNFGHDPTNMDSNPPTRLGRDEGVSIPSPCPNCHAMGECLTALTAIPHFKEVIIMAFTCEKCGYRNSEVRGGGAIPTYGTTVTLSVEGPDDMKRDVLKSDSCKVRIPEIDLELSYGTLGGVYTKTEGLLQKIYKSLLDNNPLAVGDSVTKHHATSETHIKFRSFMDKLSDIANGNYYPFTLELRDPLGNSFISAPLGSFLPPEADSQLKLVDFRRSFEENEEFGLNDMNTKDFESGVEYDDNEIILPDRETHKVKKGPDHPNLFAKGVEDATPGGRYFGNSEETSQPTTSQAETIDENDSYYYSEGLKHGWKALKPDENFETTEEETEPDEIFIPRRYFDEEDRDLDYIPREEFGGPKPGYVFRLGIKGLGYYEDKKFKTNEMKEES